MRTSLSAPVRARENPWLLPGTLVVYVVSALYFFALGPGRTTSWSGSLPGFSTLCALPGPLLTSWIAFAAVYAGVLWVVGRTPPRHFTGLALTALAACLPFLLLERLNSVDIFEYLIRGRMLVIYHRNPFLALPTEFPGDPYYPFLYWTKIPWVYGPFWLFVVSAVAALRWSIDGSIIALKGVLTALHIANGGLIWTLFRSLPPGRRARLCALYLFCPLAVWEFAGNGHCDAAMIFFILLGFVLSTRARPRSAAAALTAAVLIKIHAGPILVTFLCSEWAKAAPGTRLRTALRLLMIPTAMTIIFYVPFVHSAEALTAPFTGGAGRMASNSWASALHHWTGWGRQRFYVRVGNLIIAMSAISAWAVALAKARWQRPAAWFAFWWSSAGAVWFQPWYSLVAVALAAAAPVDLLLPAVAVLTFLAPFTYPLSVSAISAPMMPITREMSRLAQILPVMIATLGWLAEWRRSRLAGKR